MYYLSDIYIIEGNKKFLFFCKVYMDNVKIDLYFFFILLNLNC